MPKFIDIEGQTFGKALAVKGVDDHIKPSGQRVTRYLCLCECGKTFIAQKQNLVRLHTTSCGCARGKKKGSGMKHCAFLPVAVECQALECQKCGWNPFNEDLRNRRIAKITRKDGTDE